MAFITGQCGESNNAPIGQQSPRASAPELRSDSAVHIQSPRGNAEDADEEPASSFCLLCIEQRMGLNHNRGKDGLSGRWVLTSTLSEVKTVQHSEASWDSTVALREIVGYLNFSQGKPDVRFQRNINEFYRYATSEKPWRQLQDELAGTLTAVRGTTAAFRDVTQAEAVLPLVFENVLPAYRSITHTCCFICRIKNYSSRFSWLECSRRRWPRGDRGTRPIASCEEHGTG